MKKIVLLLCIALGSSTISFGQLNNYKYVVVPTRFQVFNEDNKFRTSTFIKYLFNSEGFSAVYGDNLPEDLLKNRCLGVNVQLIDDSSLFVTKTQIRLTYCNGFLVLMSQEGRSKIKDYEQAYREAISESFGSFRGLNYSYKPAEQKVNATESVTISFKNDVKSLESESQAKTNKEAIETRAAAAIQSSPALEVLYAQPINGGYQLVDTKPQVVYLLKSTSRPDVFLVNKDGKNGVVFKNEGKWFIEMDEQGGKTQEINIKF